MLAGHLDTVPLNDNLPSRNDGTLLHGLGACDMKGGDAVILRLAATVPEPVRDVTFILYDARRSRASTTASAASPRATPTCWQADFAILMEPSDAVVEAGCQGTMRVERHRPRRARPQRAFVDGRQRHPRLTPVLERLTAYDAADAGDRRADLPRGPERRRHQRWRRRQRAARRVHGLGQLPLRARPQRGRGRGVPPRLLRRGTTCSVTDSAPGALPGLDRPAAKEFVEAVGGTREPEVRLDRRRPLQRSRRAGGQLRSRRPDAGPQAGGVRARRPGPPLRARAGRLAGGGR